MVRRHKKKICCFRFRVKLFFLKSGYDSHIYYKHLIGIFQKVISTKIKQKAQIAQVECRKVNYIGTPQLRNYPVNIVIRLSYFADAHVSHSNLMLFRRISYGYMI